VVARVGAVGKKKKKFHGIKNNKFKAKIIYLFLKCSWVLTQKNT